MKHWFQAATAAVALAACTTAAFAQTPAPNATGSPRSPRFQQMRQMHEQMRGIMTQSRTQMINALTPAHRTLLSNVVGQLAVATTPDFRSAVQQLDSALSSSEKQAILTAQSNERSQMQRAFEQMRAQMPPPSGGARRQPLTMGGPGGGHGRRAPDAGFVLLHHAMMVGGPAFVQRERRG